MEITVKRQPSAQGATLGDMSVDGVWECFTLEPEVREVEGQPVSTWKVPNKTAIPRGRYRVTITFSPHFNRDLPLINDVPGFTAVRIHNGNKAADTEACTLVGQTKEGNLVYKSVAALDALFPKIKAAIDAGQEVWYSVS
jgi:hypothetical protein